jgi:hypothetical protein
MNDGLPYKDEETPKHHKCNSRCNIKLLVHFVLKEKTGYEGYHISQNHLIGGIPTTNPIKAEEN